MNIPKISILLPTKNRAIYLKYAVTSLLQQSYKNFEVIVSDNNSSDSTINVVGKFNDGRIKYFNTGKDVNVDVNWNFAFSKSVGKYIIM